MAGIGIDSRVQLTTDFILLGFQSRFRGSDSEFINCEHSPRSSILLRCCGCRFTKRPPTHPKLIKGIGTLDPRRLHKALVLLEILELFFNSMRFHKPSGQALWGDTPGVYLSPKIIAVSRSTFQWFANKAQDISILDSGASTRNLALACFMHVRFHSSDTNQGGKSTARMRF